MIANEYAEKFMSYIHHYVSPEIKWRVYEYQGVPILTMYFRGFKINNTQIDKAFVKMDDLSKWREVRRLRNRITTIKRPSSQGIAKDLQRTHRQIQGDMKYSHIEQKLNA